MRKSTLMVHAGGFEAALEDVRRRTQYGEFLDLVTRSCESVGIRPMLDAGSYALRNVKSRDKSNPDTGDLIPGSTDEAAQFFAVIPCEGTIRRAGLSHEALRYLEENEVLSIGSPESDPTVAALGLQDSTNGTLAKRVSGGTYVFNCDNQAMHGDFNVACKNTKNALENLSEDLQQAIKRFPQLALGMLVETAQMRHFHPTDLEIDALLGRLLRNEALPGSTLAKVPSLLQSEDEIGMHGRWDADGRPSAWRIYNALTQAQKTRPVATQFRTGHKFTGALNDIGLSRGRQHLIPELRDALVSMERELVNVPDFAATA